MTAPVKRKKKKENIKILQEKIIIYPPYGIIFVLHVEFISIEQDVISCTQMMCRPNQEFLLPNYLAKIIG